MLSALRPSPELDLAQRAASGDTVAIGALLKKLAPGMVRAVQALMGSKHPDVDDVIQQSLIALVQALPAFRGECSPAHYASRIVARIAVAARYRARIRGDRHDAQTEVDSLQGTASQHDEVASQQRQALIRGLLSELPEEQAETLALRVVLGFSLPEVADATGVPLNTVRSRVRLAKEALRRRIDEDPRLRESLGKEELE